LSGNVFEVLATGGDTALGGDDIDQLIADLMSQYFLRTYHADPRADPSARATLRARAETLKMALSSQDEATIELNDIVRGDGGVFLQTRFLLRRADLERIAQPLIERTLETCRFSIETIGLKLSEIERVILVGGSTRMPLVVRKVEEYFGKPATGRVNPDEVVALGAAIQAAALSRVSRDRSIVPPTPSPFAPSPSRPPTPSPFAPASSRPPTRPPIALTPVGGAQTIPDHAPEWEAEASDRPTPRSSPASRLPPRDLSFDLDDEPTPKPISVPPADRRTFEAELLLPRPSQPPSPSNGPPPLPARTGEPRAGSIPAARPSVRVGSASPSAGRYSLQAPSPSSAPVPRAEISPSKRPAPLLIDVTPISLGVETAGGFCDFLIRANTPVPCDRTRVFLTASDGQTGVVVKVAQGESLRFGENTYLGDLHLTGLAPAARGEVQVAVTFEIDVDGILNVRAKDEGSGRETAARLHMVGTQTEAGDLQAMFARQTQKEIR
jgi:molecular chaperone DnaK